MQLAKDYPRTKDKCTCGNARFRILTRALLVACVFRVVLEGEAFSRPL